MKPAKLLFSIFIITALISFVVPVHKVLAAEATLELSPVSGTIKEGETLNVNIVVNPDGAAVGAVEIYMDFDPDKFKIEVDTSGSDPKFTGFAPESKVDNDAGEISFAAWTDAGSPLIDSDPGTVAVLKVTAKASSGTGKLLLIFVPEATKDSCWVIEQGTVDNILSSVSDGTYTLAAADKGDSDDGDDDSDDDDDDDGDDDSDDDDSGSDDDGTDTNSGTGGTASSKGAVPETGDSAISIFVGLWGLSLLLSGILLIF